MTQQVPGRVGLPVVSETAYQFYKDPIKFIDDHLVEYNGSRLFKTRFLNKATTFVCSHRGVKEALEDAGSCMEMGYKAFMHQIYGDNILFTDGAEGGVLRLCLGQLFSPACLEDYQPIVNRITKRHLDSLQLSEPVCIYRVFKRLTTELCLSLFLNLDFEEAQEVAETIVALTTTHWHGITSVPVSFRVSLASSTYSKALNAKTKLLTIIQEKLTNGGSCQGFSRTLQDLPFPQEQHVANHMLLFTSALVPKALASLLTSFVLALVQQSVPYSELHTDSSLLKCILLEVMRLYPPFLGGRRLVRKDCVIDDHRIAAGTAIVFMTFAAHRDPAVFSDADTFQHERWREKSDLPRPQLFSFGHGPRKCLGEDFIWNILTHILTSFTSKFDWPLELDQEVIYKWLPVCRPQNDLSIALTRREADAAE